MKPFLAIDLTEDKKNDKLNGEEFLALRTSAAMAQVLESSTEQAEETIEESKLPLVVRIVHWICGAYVLLFAFSILKAIIREDGVSLGEAYQNVPWMFWTAGVCLLVWVILKFMSKKKEKNVFEDEGNTQVFSKLEGICDTIFTELSVPADSKKVDLLSFFYKENNGEIKVKEKPMQMHSHFNPVFHIFSDSENLYLANLEGKYAIPLSSLQAIRTVKKRIRLQEWNKDEPFNSGIYKQYKLTNDDYGCIHCKIYHILEFNFNGDTWGIYFPCYELPVFEEISGLKAD